MADKSKRLYQKPQIKQIKLRIKDVVLANCKAISGSGSGTNAGNYCQTRGRCSRASLGS